MREEDFLWVVRGVFAIAFMIGAFSWIAFGPKVATLYALDRTGYFWRLCGALFAAYVVAWSVPESLWNSRNGDWSVTLGLASMFLMGAYVGRCGLRRAVDMGHGRLFAAFVGGALLLGKPAPGQLRQK